LFAGLHYLFQKTKILDRADAKNTQYYQYSCSICGSYIGLLAVIFKFLFHGIGGPFSRITMYYMYVYFPQLKDDCICITIGCRWFDLLSNPTSHQFKKSNSIM